VAMAIITIGEMLTAPTSQALVARFAPDDMRGRYMAIFGMVSLLCENSKRYLRPIQTNC